MIEHFLYMFKGIKSAYFVDLQFIFSKIQQMVCQIRAHKNHLKLNRVGFSEIFSQNARNIH